MNMMLHHLARLEMMKAEEQGIDLSYEQALNIVNKQVMANEFSFMFINIEDTLAQYKEGMLSKDMVVEEIQLALDKYKNTERATITF